MRRERDGEREDGEGRTGKECVVCVCVANANAESLVRGLVGTWKFDALTGGAPSTARGTKWRTREIHFGFLPRHQLSRVFPPINSYFP